MIPSTTEQNLSLEGFNFLVTLGESMHLLLNNALKPVLFLGIVREGYQFPQRRRELLK
jgi:hypothetical protein